jgi:hypothetical protein
MHWTISALAHPRPSPSASACHIPGPYAVSPLEARSDMSKRASRRAIDKVEREWNDDASHTRDMIDGIPRSALRVSRVTRLLAAAVLVCGLWLVAPTAAQVSVQPAANVATLTPKRAMASMAAVMALSGAIIGGFALARPAGRNGTGNRRRKAIAALVLGPTGLVIGGLVVVTADGGLGTGNGIAGGIVAMMVGLIGTALGGLALARSRRPA